MRNFIYTLILLILVSCAFAGCGMLAVKATAHCDTYASGDWGKFRNCINL